MEIKQKKSKISVLTTLSIVCGLLWGLYSLGFFEELKAKIELTSKTVNITKEIPEELIENIETTLLLMERTTSEKGKNIMDNTSLAFTLEDNETRDGKIEELVKDDETLLELTRGSYKELLKDTGEIVEESPQEEIK